jgi:hypothetical protein
MRNRPLHDALRDFALEAAALLTDDLRAGAEVEFDVIDEGGAHGPALYHYKARTEPFIAERWARLRELPACARACGELGAGAALWLRVNGLRGEQAEPALRAMLERLYEDATSFGFPEERFERLYREVEATLYHDSVRAQVVAPLRGADMEADRVDLDQGLSLQRGELVDAPHESAVLCVVERDAPADEGIPSAEAAERFAAVVRALRLWAPGFVALGGPAWRRTDDGPWQPLPLGGGATDPAAATFLLHAGEEEGLREFFGALAEAEPSPTVAWALRRFEMGCDRIRGDEALSDHLLAVRALLDATSDAGQASLALRVAALCAEEGARKHVQRRMEAAMALERFVMGGELGFRHTDGSPRELAAEVEAHLRALLRDVLCGYLDDDLKSVADDILLEVTPEPYMEIRARDLRQEAAVSEPPSPPPAVDEPETSEMEPVQVELEGVTPSGDWGWDEPEDYSAPV